MLVDTCTLPTQRLDQHDSADGCIVYTKGERYRDEASRWKRRGVEA